MTETEIDREYVLAALCGVLSDGWDPQPLLDCYSISQSEQRRVAMIAIQNLMSNGSSRPRRSAARVDELARQFAIDKTCLARLAEECLHGLFFGDDNDTADLRDACHIVKHYLRGQQISLRDTPHFACTARFTIWQPATVVHLENGEPMMYALVDHEALQTHLRDRTLPEAYKKLVRITLSCEC